MVAQHPAIGMHDLPRFGRAGAQFFDNRCVVAVWHEADVLTVGFVGHRQPVFGRQPAGVFLALQMAQRKAQVIELFLGGGEQEIALIARRIGGAMQLGASRAHLALDVMAGGHAIGIEIARGFQQILELDPLVAADAGHRGGAAQIAVGKLVHHRIAKDVLVIQHVMRKAHFLGHPAGIVDVAAGAAGAFLGQGRAVIVELQGDAHHVIALARQLGGDDRAVDPARHRHDDAGLRGGLGKAEGIERLGGKGGHANLHFGSPREYRKIRDTLKTGFHRRLNTSAHARDK